MKDLITEARELCERATEGPWTGKENIGVQTATGEDVFETGCGCCTSEHLSADDAAFIARSRTLIPELCDALEKAEAEAKALSDCNRKMKEQNMRLIWRNWIPVTERLPDYDVPVLVTYLGFTDSKPYSDGIARWVLEMNGYTGGWEWTLDGDEVEVTITHWMPLPEPPKGE